MAADLAQAVGTLVDEIADLEIDEDLLHPASGSVGDSEEEEAARPRCAGARTGRRGQPGPGQVRQGRRRARERPGWQGSACCRGGRPEVSVGRRQHPHLCAARRVRGQGGVGAGEEALGSQLTSIRKVTSPRDEPS